MLISFQPEIPRVATTSDTRPGPNPRTGSPGRHAGGLYYATPDKSDIDSFRSRVHRGKMLCKLEGTARSHAVPLTAVGLSVVKFLGQRTHRLDEAGTIIIYGVSIKKYPAKRTALYLTRLAYPLAKCPKNR